MTRRSLLVILSVFALRRKAKAFDGVVSPQTKLMLTTDGVAKTFEGYVVGLPQGNREAVATYIPGVDDALTSQEWARRVFYVSDTDDVDGAFQWLANQSIAQNDPGSCGCGEVSRHVPLTRLIPDGAGFTLEEDAAINGSTEFYSLAASGSRVQNSAGKPEFHLDEFWISPSEWEGDAAKLRDTRISEAADAASVCQGLAKVFQGPANGLR